MVIATRKPLCNKRWSASPASQDLQLTQLRHPWVGFVNGMVASHLLCHSGTINRHSLNGALLS
ncbi:Uncharacterised protein [Klebsiella pneumoniae]|nr:Uncharacterised protein [Klebsiella pneumoniae]